MGDNPGKSFKVPKKKKENKDSLWEIDVNSRDAKDITNIVQRSYIETSYTPIWQLKTVQYVQNRELEERYRQKRSEMKEEGRNARDLAEQYTFLVFRDSSMVPKVAKDGLKCRSLPFNALGNSKLGLYLSRNADIHLRLAENWETDTCIMFVFKTTPGKCKVLLSGSDGGEGMEPTPNYDCHVAQYQPRSCDPIHLQLARSQIYLYEYTEDCEPSTCPRHCLPYAVLTYQKFKNKSQTSQPQTDSYSKRPVPLSDRTRADQHPSNVEVKSKVDPIYSGDPISKRDPRLSSKDSTLNPQDPRLAYARKQGGDVGLCVPRLTAGPPPPTLGATQGSGQGRVGSSAYQQNDSVYQPSFGPQFDNELTEKRLLLLKAQEQSLLLLKSKLGQPQPTNQTTVNLPPKDPRLRKTDPRLDPRLRDPRLQKSDSINSQTTGTNVTKASLHTILSNNDSSAKSRKRMSFDDYKQKVGIQSALQTDIEQEGQGSENKLDEMYDPSDPTPDADLSFTTQSSEIESSQSEGDQVENDGNDTDLIDTHDDMKKTLNELIDLSPVKQSPKAIADEVEEDDPTLAAAMRMLVDHSGDVSLLTEALRKLQESAEELGDALHDPSFLVKAIAENVESLKLSKSVSNNAEMTQNIKESGTTVSVLVKSRDSPSNDKEPRPSNASHNQEIMSSIGKSPMAKSMQSTLEELQRAEQVSSVDNNIFKGEVFSYLQNESGPDIQKVDTIGLSTVQKQNLPLEVPGLKYDTTKVENMEMDVEDIPLPEADPVPPSNKSNIDKQVVSFKLKGMNPMGVTSSFRDDDDNKATPIEDKDERTNIRYQVVEKKDLPVFGGKKIFSDSGAEVDRDYRVSEKGFSVNIQPSTTHLYELSADRIDITKASDISSFLKDKDDRHKNSFSAHILIDKPQEPHVNGGISNELKDVDEREAVQLPEKGNTVIEREDNDHGLTLHDKDERIIKAYIQASDDPCLLDKDERKSKSRSQSPMNISPVFVNIAERPLSPEDETDRQDLKIADNRIRSRSASPSLPAEETNDKEVKIIPLHNLDDSQSSSDSGLFDAYSLASKANDRENKKFAESAMEVSQQGENEFGDVDWRLAAEAAEMGDIDLRASQSSDADLRDSSSTNNLISQDSSSYIHPEYTSYHETTKMEPILDFQDQPVKPAGSYSTNNSTLESYTTYKNSFPSYSTTGSYHDEYRTSTYQGQTYSDKYSYYTGGRENSLNWSDTRNLEQYSTRNSNTPQTNHIGIEGLQNIMNNLDFSSLKNILAVVQQPALPQGSGYSSSNLPDGSVAKIDLHKQDNANPLSGQARTESNVERENQPAFCTGLSFLKSKQPKVDKTRAKYSGLAKGNVDVGLASIKHVSSTSSLDKYETGYPDSPIPLLDGFPQNTDGVSGIEYGQENMTSRIDPADRDIQSSEDVYPTLPGFDPPRATEKVSVIPGLTFTQSSSPPRQELIHDTNTTGKPFTFSEDIPERDISSEWYEEIPSRDSRKTENLESKVKSPKKKSQRTRTESYNSENTDSWQNAILESIEQSALAVKSDDSVIMESESPQIESETKSLERNEVSLAEGKRPLDETDSDTDHKRFRADIDTDDEDDGLVIDLDEPQTSEIQEPAAEHLVIDVDDEACHDDETPKRTEKGLGRSTPLLDENQDQEGKNESDGEDEKNREEDLDDEDDVFPTTNHELKKFIERKRKNIVIKLKGETKIVNPKTGKAYNNNVVGSAIEVLGQPKRVTPSISSSIHPVHGITSSIQQEISSSSDFKGSSIATLINRNPVLSPRNTNQDKVNPSQHTHVAREYTHPYTGQTMVYPISAGPNLQQSQTLSGHSMSANCHTDSGFQTRKQEHVSQDIEKEQYGMTIPTLGSQSTRRRESVLDEKPSTSNEDHSVRIVTISKKEKNYELSKISANKYIKTETSANKYIKTESNSNLPSGSDRLTEQTDKKLNLKIIKNETSSKERLVKIVTDQTVKRDEATKDDQSKKQDTVKEEADEDSELEEGEISDDDDDDDYDVDIHLEQSKNTDNTRLHRDRTPQSDFDFGKFPHYRQEYSSRNYSTYETGPSFQCLPHKGGSQWSELLHYQERKEVPASLYYRAKPEPKASPTSKMGKEATSVLSKSAETITKAKQKMLARNQVKTLGDWLKIELEIDNIQPLQNIIPYSLNTDLSVIPKKRRRKIRLKVKNTIEKEGIKQSKFETETEEKEKGVTFFIPSYLPEVSHDQIDRELKMLRDVRANLHKRPYVLGNYDENTFVKAVTTVEEEMFSLLNRTNYFGYPHRRVPHELLLESESKSYRSEFGDIFLILMNPISLKVYNKLNITKSELQTLFAKKRTNTDQGLLEKNETEIKSKIMIRQNLLRAFTGYLNKKRVLKVQELSDNFTMVYEFFKAQKPPYPDSVLRFIRTTKMDIKQHLLIAKQYLEMEEKL